MCTLTASVEQKLKVSAPGHAFVQMLVYVSEQQQAGVGTWMLLLTHAPQHLDECLAGSQNTEIACLTCTPARPPLCAQVCAEGPRLLDYELHISHAHVVKLVVGTSAALLHIPVHSCAEVVPHSFVAFLLLQVLLLPASIAAWPCSWLFACLLQGREEHSVSATNYEDGKTLLMLKPNCTKRCALTTSHTGLKPGV